MNCIIVEQQQAAKSRIGTRGEQARSASANLVLDDGTEPLLIMASLDTRLAYERLSDNNISLHCIKRVREPTGRILEAFDSKRSS